jgi:hypothetical protein
MFTVELINPDSPDSEIVVTGELTEGEKLDHRGHPNAGRMAIKIKMKMGKQP